MSWVFFSCLLSFTCLFILRSMSFTIFNIGCFSFYQRFFRVYYKDNISFGCAVCCKYFPCAVILNICSHGIFAHCIFYCHTYSFFLNIWSLAILLIRRALFTVRLIFKSKLYSSISTLKNIWIYPTSGNLHFWVRIRVAISIVLFFLNKLIVIPMPHHEYLIYFH